jgi:putative ABC transport system permease protein
MLFVEALSVGIIGAMVGIIGGLILTHIVPYLLDAANLPMDMYYEPITFIICFALGILITMVSSLGPSFKSSKLNIIEAIKYE